MATVKYLDENGLSTVWSKVKGIVTPKADKVSGATAGHLAGLNSSGDLTDSGLAATNIAQKDGSYSGMTVGAAEDLVSAESVASEFTSRITGGSTAVGKGGTALVDKIKGRTLIWNQACKYMDVSNTVNGVTITVSDNRIVLSGTATSNIGRTGMYLTTGIVKLITGHKYIYINTVGVQFYVTSQSLAGSLYQGFANTSDIFTFTKSSFSDGLVAPVVSAGTECNYSGYFYIIDLTLMFGAGNEPSTVAEFEALYPGPYYPYEDGKPVNNGKQTEFDLVMNQLVANGNFANGTTGWSQFNSTIAASSGELTVTKSAMGAGTGGFAMTTITGDPAHRYYVGCDAIALSDTEICLGFHSISHTVSGNESASTKSATYKRIHLITSPVASDHVLCVRVGIGASADGVASKVKNVMLVDLTLMFGAGNEPNSPEEFEAMFPADYYAYDTGTQRHYSFPQFKTKIETVGWNIWDEEWEVGAFDTTTGAKKTASNTIRSKNYIKVLPNTTYYASLASKIASVYYYDNNQNFISFEYNSSGTRTTPANCYYMMFVGTSSYGVTYKNDICISLSDPSRNGTYEPYWRSELELGLGDIKVKSHNLWDEEWEAGVVSSVDGTNASNNNRIRSKNYIPCIPGTNYYVKIPTGAIGYRFYDANKNYLSAVDDRSNNTVTSPANAYYMRFCTTTNNYGVTYKNDICINLSDPAFNGRYEPYGDGGVISITGGLKSAGTVYDEISGGKLVKRIESMDLGTPTWNMIVNSNPSIFYTASISDARKRINNQDVSNIVTTKYAVDLWNNVNDKTIKIGGSGESRIYIYDSAYSDAATFKAAMSGVPLYYELAQPIEYELAEAIPTAMRNDPYGTERRLPEDTAATVLAPFRADITYSTNIKEAVQSLPQNYININSMQDFLAALGALMGGTWTMRPADGKFDFTFTPNPSNE